MIKNYSQINTPLVLDEWKLLSIEQRLSRLIQLTKDIQQFSIIQPMRALDNGQVFVELKEVIPASQRGMLLLDYEDFIKSKIDNGLNVWCEPIGDKNSLRNLRGIQLKS